MKKLLLVTTITILGLAHVNAQDVEFGIKSGLNFASANGGEFTQLNPITSFNFGIMAEIPISEKFSFQPELMFSQQGYSDNGIIELNYLNAPLMIKYYLTKKLSLEAGPQIGYLLSATEVDKAVKIGQGKLDVGVNFGIGYKLDNGLNFGMRYNLGLSELTLTENHSKRTHTFRNSTFQFTIGYFF